MASRFCRPRNSQGFSLLEIVLALIVVLCLFFLSVEGYLHLVDSSAIDAGAQMITDTLTEARQDAITQNSTVEVRLYALPATPVAYGSLQLHWKRSDGTTPPIARPLVLPAAAVIDATPLHSSLVTTNAQPPTTDPTDPRINSLTRAFHFLPDGSTDLAATGTWLLTLRVASKSDPANFPPNWASVQLDPVTGRTQIYRP